MPCMVEKIATIYAAAAYFGVFNKRRPRPTATIVDPVVAQKFRIVNCGPTQKLERRTPNMAPY
jgi:hypothetical protein